MTWYREYREISDCSIAQHHDQLPRHLGVYSIALLTKARRPDGVLKACWYTPIYTLMASQHAWPRDGRGFHNPTSYLVEMCLSCNFFSDSRGGGWAFGLPLREVSHQTFHIFTTRRYATCGICRRRVSVCVSVCLSVWHTPVLYQNG